MKALALALIAIAPLSACSVDDAGNNQARSGADNGTEVAAADQAGPAPAVEGDGAGGPVESEAAAPKPGDVPIKGQRSGPAGAPPPEEADRCGASRYQWLVGRQRSAIPPEPAGARWRVTCTGCPITMDYAPARLNIFYDAETERVEEVRCG